MKKKFLTLLMAVTLGLSLAACGGGAAEEPADDVAVEEEVVEEDEYVEEEVVEEDEYAALYDLFTGGFTSGEADEEGYIYYFACDDDITFASFVMLAEEDMISVNWTGDVVEYDDGSLSIVDEAKGEEFNFWVESTDNPQIVLVTLDDGTEVEMAAIDPAIVVDCIIAIDQETEIVG